MLILDPPEVILEFKPGKVAKLLILQDCLALDKSGPRKEEVNEGGGGREGGCSLWLITGHLTAPTTAADTDASPPTFKTTTQCQKHSKHDFYSSSYFHLFLEHRHKEVKLQL